MEIISWNVNGIRAAIRNGFSEWFEKAQPDILCLQETRVHPGELTPALREPKGYHAYWNPAQRKGYSGTTLFAKEPPRSVTGIGLSEFDSEGRVQIAEFSTFTLINAYFPNSQPERARIDYKLAFCEAIIHVASTLHRQKKNVLLCGDYNIAHTAIDLARPKENEDNPGYLPEERAAMDAFLKVGYIDTFRHFTPEPGHYTWWSYRARAREKNIGWRLDYHCVNATFLPHVSSSTILSSVLGSDHCPVSITLT